MIIHFVFDLLALLSGVLLSGWFRRRYALQLPMGLSHSSQHHYYLLALLLGLAAGSTAFGTLNLYLAGQGGIAKSMLGGVFGAIVAAEVFKHFAGIRQSTGLYFVPGLILLIAVGRVGCFLAGLPDFTYGVATSLPWGVDFGDGIERHPVQLYETFTMLIFLAVLLLSYPRQPVFWQRQGFYVFVLVYAGQRFAWEFLKPYPPVLAGLNLFHWISLALLVYALLMLNRSQADVE
ncbi:MAG TPA: prolipoprotein diacylglyceryl transferase [Candidatus Thiothrix moscowensis]|uniref:prolipoprotein diacylglyceryl transferase n=1 Tax=unclassified Thiothrix TaxID=2636184 RepID=UPI0025EB53E2|nr:MULTISPECIES: prolipoprotein diacylglyceryl transferase family protein [unclassified Thiothrix]HRJ53373.1 prolipoprotein diacylglyceryl transferase [Candidatus Thiothrix moscowensis]HRJ94650.1 prolipoprotein diacylglyceryl transferase [Candidatus Thiothrix moscowensis]